LEVDAVGTTLAVAAGFLSCRVVVPLVQAAGTTIMIEISMSVN